MCVLVEWSGTHIRTGAGNFVSYTLGVHRQRWIGNCVMNAIDNCPIREIKGNTKVGEC